MKKTRWIGALACLLCLLTVLTSCGTPALRYDEEEGGFVGQGGLVYVRAGKSYAAVGIDKEVATAKIKQDGDDILLYPVCSETADMDREIWMAAEDFTLYCKKGTTLPKLWEMQIGEVRVMQSTSATFIVAYLTEAEEIAGLINAYQNKKAFSFQTIQGAYINEPPTKYLLACASQNYDGLYYMLTYYRFEYDVKVTETLDASVTRENFVPAYDTYYTLRDGEGGVLVAEYNFGKNIIQDRTTGECYTVSGVFEAHFDKNN